LVQLFFASDKIEKTFSLTSQHPTFSKGAAGNTRFLLQAFPATIVRLLRLCASDDPLFPLILVFLNPVCGQKNPPRF